MIPELYLSRLVVDLRSRRVQQDLANPYELHRTVMAAFGDGCRGNGERVLYRLDHVRGAPVAMVLVQSVTEPDWAFLAAPAARGYLAEGWGENPAVKRFAPRFAEGQVLAFRLRANPTVRRGGKRLGLYREEEQLAWLRRKGEEAGFVPIAVRATQEDALRGSLEREGAVHRLKLVSVRFEGYLRVVDAARLAGATARGIGAGKGFGFGLLSLARA